LTLTADREAELADSTVHGAAARLDAEVLTRLESSKAERLAMEEVRCGLVYYDLPEWSPRQVEEVIVEPPRRPRAGR